MPRETISYGKRILYVTHPATETVGEWEEVYDASTQIDGERPKGVPSAGPTLEVVWSRPESDDRLPLGEEASGFVQISLDLPREEWKRHGGAILSDPDITARAVYSEGLSRSQINKLIRTLKRARDAAFGADE